MRIEIHKGTRSFLLFSAGMAILLFSFFIFQEYTTKNIIEESIPVYSYKSEGGISYNVLLKPNILYGETNIDEGFTYISEFISTIITTYNYSFVGDSTASISGDYDLTVTIEGYTESQNNDNEKSIKSIWKKDFIVFPKTNFESNSASYSINKQLSINYSEYNNLAQEIISATKISLSTRLSAVMNINIKVMTSKGTKEEKYSQILIIPLGTNSFNIQKFEIGDKTGSIEEIHTIEPPVDDNKVIIHFMSLIFVSITFLFLTIFTRSKYIEENIIELNKIFKKHGSRLVAIKSEIKANIENHLKVNSIDDLVKISDEVSKPIIYCYNNDPNKISQFFVSSGAWMYEFNLGETIDEKMRITQKTKPKRKKAKTKKEDLKSKIRPVNIQSGSVESNDLSH